MTLRPDHSAQCRGNFLRTSVVLQGHSVDHRVESEAGSGRFDDRPGTRLTVLAEAARITKQTAGALVDQLERSGYVVRRPDPTDARA
jgi:MarR family